MQEAFGWRNHGGSIWRRHHGGGIMEEASWRRHHGGGIWRRSSEGGIIEEASWRKPEEELSRLSWQVSGGSLAAGLALGGPRVIWA